MPVYTQYYLDGHNRVHSSNSSVNEEVRFRKKMGTAFYYMVSVTFWEQRYSSWDALRRINKARTGDTSS